MPRPISEQVVVITGASSGIGRETARALASHGASLVLAARNQEGLHEAVREVEEAGGRAHAVATDVSDWRQVDHLADEAMLRFSRIDAWVNNAGVALYAGIEDMVPEEMRRVVEVNLLGEMYGCRAAVERMRGQDEGTIVNVSSVLARRSVPLQSAYCAAKRGVSGFSEALRMELAMSHPGLKVVEILPSSINTPLFAHARSKMGVHPMPIPPIYQPAIVAEAIVGALEHPVPEIVVGGAGKVFDVGERINPRLLDAYLLQDNRGVEQQQTDQPDDGRDNLFEPIPEAGSTTGRWSAEARETSGYTRVFEMHPERKLLLGAVGFLGSLLLARRLAGRL